LYNCLKYLFISSYISSDWNLEINAANS